ncbi:IclR family transcriptional regulator [Cupriavidus necator]|uniref:IclR family transcriptional regulator n=1 Tax=Cupriavidus necator TaxID=106590 RepID=UPI003F503EC8
MASVVPRDRRAAARAGKPQNLTRAVLREPGDRQFASTLERGLRVLQCFSADSPELGNAEIAARTGLPKPTVSRLTHTLVRLGYLRRYPGSGDFGLGMSILCLGYPLLAGLQLRRLAAGPMKELADLIDGSVAIGVRDHLRIVALENITTRDVLKRKPGTGLTLPLVSSTAGTAWLVGATADERKRAIREIEYAEPGSWARQADEFDAFRKEFARLGYVRRRNVLRPDTVALGVPLRRRPGAELLVLSCVLATSAATADALEQRAAVGLLTAAKYIGEKLQQP